MPGWEGIWPVAPTPFLENGEVDYDGMRRVLDCMVDQGSTGICILANFSEQFLLSDAERESLTRLSLEHVAGRVPVIVTISHFATPIAVSRARLAHDLGAAAVMMMAPYHGALLRGTAEQTFEQFRAVGEVGIPIMVQDAPVSGTPMSAAFLARMANEIEHLAYFKIETPGAAAKLRELIALGGEAIEGPWDGEEGITLLADLDAGATGAMTGGGFPDGMRSIVDPYLAGDREAAVAAYGRWLPLINAENRQGGIQTAKALMLAGGVIECDTMRHPFPNMHPATRTGLLDAARRLDPLVLRWAR